MSIAALPEKAACERNGSPRYMRAAEPVSAQARPAEPEPPIRILAAVERNCHPAILWGAFSRGELMSVRSVDGRSWFRERWEACETFEDRVVRDLEEAAVSGCLCSGGNVERSGLV
jgi:hypothetical protein